MRQVPATRPALSESAGIYNAEDYKEVKSIVCRQELLVEIEGILTS